MSAGILGKLEFVNTTLKAEGGFQLGADPGFYGWIGLKVLPIKLEALLYAQVKAWFLDRTFTWSIYRYRMQEISMQIGGPPEDLVPAEAVVAVCPTETPSRSASPETPVCPAETIARRPKL